MTFDAEMARLSFTYKYEGHDRSRDVTGIHVSVVERSSKLKAPARYDGVAHDLNDPVRIAVHSLKIDSLLLPWGIALTRAQTEFKDVLQMKKETAATQHLPAA